MNESEICRFGHMLPKPDGTMDFIVHSRLANQSVLDEYNDLVKVLWRLQPVVIALEVVERNHRELVQDLERFRNSLDALSSQNIVPINLVFEGMICVSGDHRFVADLSSGHNRVEMEALDPWFVTPSPLSGFEKCRTSTTGSRSGSGYFG